MELRMDLNADLGEGCPWDLELLKRVTSASVCCGAHAGTPQEIQATLQAAKQQGVVVGAHPGYPDRAHFGRREQAIDRQAAHALILDQVKQLAAWATPLGVKIQFLKPHGALYNQAQVNPEIAAGVVEAAGNLDLPVLGLPGSYVAAESQKQGVRFLAEGFADRRYTAEGRLAPRTEPGSVLEGPREISTQVERLIQQGIDTLCIHGDTPGAVRLADVVRTAAQAAGAKIFPFLTQVPDLGTSTP